MVHTVDILKPRPNVCNCVCISLNENLRIFVSNSPEIVHKGQNYKSM